MVRIIIFFAAILITGPQTAVAEDTPEKWETPVEEIVKRLEDRYSNKNFSARFHQESVLKAMDITDTADGNAWFKHPGMMRWEYERPERHVIITDGDTLWIYRPADNQVVIGDAESHFGNGKGASFLSDFRQVREAFDIRPESEKDSEWRIKLIPRERNYDLAAVYMTISKQSYAIKQVTTENAYGDITRITFEQLKFHDSLDDSLFSFEIPDGVDIVEMDE